jgi:hypothetical protein
MLERHFRPESDEARLFLIILEVRKKVCIGHVQGFFLGYRITFLSHTVDPVQKRLGKAEFILDIERGIFALKISEAYRDLQGPSKRRSGKAP